ncbi:MAG: phospholipase [Halieaceae bacterium]|jgi:phospholipase/carboxylesterase|nr:phospholipase [Halieaceae bacterium]
MVQEADNARMTEDIADMIPRLLGSLEALAYVGRHLHPPNLADLIPHLKERHAGLVKSRQRLGELPWPGSLAFMQQQIMQSADHSIGALQTMEKAAAEDNGVMRAFSALQKTTRAVEALYPIADTLSPISRFFLEPAYRDDAVLLQTLTDADASREEVGTMQASNNRDQRGGVSIYVPEYYDESREWPLVVALHGGSGHGADTLWTWLREARSRGFIVLSPTSRDHTWSLMGDDVDAATIDRIVVGSCEQWNIDKRHILLTGMSDGGTYTLIKGLSQDSPFTHLAPISGTFHPLLMEGMVSVKNRPIYLVHGALDWMFKVDIARLAHETLSRAGAEVVYRELNDLSHTYPREENSGILDWFLN